MTQEEIKQICQIYDNLRTARDAATIAYNSEDTFWGHVLAIYKLSQPSTPSNIDEAAFEYAELCKYEEVDKLLCAEHFKAGAEWMARQGVNSEGKVFTSAFTSYVKIPGIEKLLKDAFPEDTEVIVQIRKKQ